MSIREMKEPLSYRGDLAASLRQHYGKAKDLVAAIPEKEFLSTSDANLLAHIVTDLSIVPISLDEGQAEIGKEETRIDVSQNWDRNPFRDRGPILVPGFRLNIKVPFRGDLFLWQLRPNVWQSVFPHGRVNAAANGRSGSLLLAYEYPADEGPENAKQRYDQDMKSVRFYLQGQKTQIESEQGQLSNIVQQAISARRNRLKDHDEQLTNMFGIPVKPPAEPTTGSSSRDTLATSQVPRPRHAKSESKWDVFLSHASEDKEDIARPLADALRDHGLKVWFDEFTLKVGDSLRRSIDKGLAKSRYGIVIISPAFLSKEWPQKELDGLVAKEEHGHKVILPVWHKLDAETLRAHSPILADRLATSSIKGLEQVVLDLLAAIE